MDRVYAFPNYIMHWVTRQSEEIFSKLAVQPTLHIILPEKKDLSIWDTEESKIY